MKVRVFLLGCLFHTFFVFTQGVENVGARSIALGEATVALVDVNSYYSNPASSSQISSTEIGMNYQNKYLINEFQQSSIAVVTPLNRGVISVAGMISGKSLFRNTRFGTGYAIKLFDVFSLGAQVNFQQIQIQGITFSNDFQASIGFLLNVSSRIKVGVAAANFGVGLFNKNKTEVTPLLIRLGGNFILNPKLSILAEIEKDVIHQQRLKFGIEYKPVVNLFLRSGVVLNEQLLSFGVGYCAHKKLTLDIGGAWQQRLGWCPSIGIRYAFNNE